jgi:uncharacterized radical SAM superfamily protein
MTRLSPETVWNMNRKEFLDFLDSQDRHKPRNIRFYAPSFMYYKTSYFCSSPKDFPTISVTGAGCTLKCKHCGGLVLETMYPATSPETLFELCAKLKREGALGCLISGGCRPDGSVPLEKFADAIAKVKRELGLTVIVHTGIIGADTAALLKEGGVDSALIDIIGSDETIREIYNLDVTTKDYERSLKALNDSGIAFVPHVIVGLHHGRLKGELNALKMISNYKPSALVTIAFMPIHKTEMEKVQPPEPEDIAKIIKTARMMFPRTPLVLGCMRPKGRHRDRTDILAIRAGVDAIAFPAEEAIKYAQNQGHKIAFSSFCCSQIYADVRGLAVSEE